MTRRSEARGRDTALVHGALIAIGALAVVDTVVVHWILGWHRLVEDWSATANLVAEIAVVLGGGVVAGFAILRERRRRQE